MARKITNVKEAIAYYEEECLKAGKVACVLGNEEHPPTKDEVTAALKDIPNHMDNCPDCTAALEFGVPIPDGNGLCEKHQPTGADPETGEIPEDQQTESTAADFADGGATAEAAAAREEGARQNRMEQAQAAAKKAAEDKAAAKRQARASARKTEAQPAQGKPAAPPQSNPTPAPSSARMSDPSGDSEPDREKSIMQALGQPWPAQDIKWLLRTTSKKRAKNDKGRMVYPEGTRGMFLAYIDARMAAQRLDDVFGPFNWETSFQILDEAKHIIECTVTITTPHNNRRISKMDVGYPNSDNDDEPMKSAYSDAFKRACVMWGIGRFLYDMEERWLPIDAYGKPIKGGGGSRQQSQTRRSSQPRTGAQTRNTAPGDVDW